MMVDKPEEGVLRVASLSDISGVVDVHLKAFEGFFLSLLGRDFLHVMYTAFLSRKGGVFVVYERNNDIQGFAVGGIKNNEKDSSLALRFLPKLALAVLPVLMKHPLVVGRRLCNRFFNLGENPVTPEKSVMLRSIAVLPSLSGGGVAGRLLGSFEEHARLLGAESVVLTTDADEKNRAIGFYSKNGYKSLSRFYQDQQRPMLFMQKKFEVNND